VSVQRSEESRAVAARPGTCWGVVTDPARIPRWLTIATAVDTTGARGEGQRVAIRGSHLRFITTITFEVDRFEEVSRYGLATNEPLPVRFRFALAPEGDERTMLHATVEADTDGLPRVATRLAVRSLRQQFARSIDKLAQLAEDD
jgi:uncharacterized protein YndB with AHSA1/START domain